MTRLLATYLLISFVFEWLLRLLMYVASALQIILLLSKHSAYCIHETRDLAPEGNWMLALAISQLITTSLFAIWKIKLINLTHQLTQEEREKEERSTFNDRTESVIDIEALKKGGDKGRM